MADLNRSAIDVLLMDKYPFGSEIFSQVQRGTPLKDLIQRKLPPMAKVDHEGRRVLVPLHTKRNPNVTMAIGPDGGFATPGHQKYAQAIYNVSTVVGGFGVDGIVFDVASGGGKSVVRQVPHELSMLMENMNYKLNWLMHQDGSGLYAVCGTTTNSNTISLASGSDMTFLQVDAEVDILDLTTGALAGGNTPQASKKQTLVITARVTTLGSESITVEQADGSQPAITTSSAHGVYEHQGQGLQIDGLGIITSTQNPTNWGDQNAQYGAIDRASADNDFWKGNQQDAQDSAGNNGVLSIQEHIQPLHNTIRTRRGQFAGNQKRLLALLGNSQDTILKNQMLHDMRTTGIRRRLKGGNWEGVEFDQTVFVLDVTAPTDKIRFLDAEATYRYIMREFYFDTKPGSQWERATDSVSSRPIERYRTYVLGRQQLLTTSCLAQGEIVNLAT